MFQRKAKQMSVTKSCTHLYQIDDKCFFVTGGGLPGETSQFRPIWSTLHCRRERVGREVGGRKEVGGREWIETGVQGCILQMATLDILNVPGSLRPIVVWEPGNTGTIILQWYSHASNWVLYLHLSRIHTQHCSNRVVVYLILHTGSYKKIR